MRPDPLKTFARQWALVLMLAEFPSVSIMRAAEHFDVDPKTIKRDLLMLRSAGFVVVLNWEGQSEYKALNAHYHQSRMAKMEAEGRRQVAAIRANRDMNHADQDALWRKCNHCGYRFKTHGNGDVDLTDVRIHKEEHAPELF